MTLEEKLTSLHEVLLFLHIAKENKVTKVAKLQTRHEVLNLTCGSFLGSLCQKNKWRSDGQKEQHIVTAHFTCSVVSKLLLIATVIFSCLVNFVSPFSFSSKWKYFVLFAFKYRCSFLLAEKGQEFVSSIQLRGPQENRAVSKWCLC